MNAHHQVSRWSADLLRPEGHPDRVRSCHCTGDPDDAGLAARAPAGREPAAAHWLALAAAPTFAVMALLTGVVGGGPLDMLCSPAHDASPLTGMVAMYVLMSAFHSAPWLKLISRRRSGARRP